MLDLYSFCDDARISARPSATKELSSGSPLVLCYTGVCVAFPIWQDGESDCYGS